MPKSFKHPPGFLTPAQLRKIAMQAVSNAVKGISQEKIVQKFERAQNEKLRQAELNVTNLGMPREVKGISFLVVIPDYFAASGGCNAMHYLAAMLAETGAAVATTHLCYFNPLIPVREKALPSDIAILPDGERFNRTGATRVCWWMLFYADAFFRSHITQDECVLVYEKKYLPSVQAACSHPVDEGDVVYLPHINPHWCFPGRKTIESCFYGSEAASKGSIPADKDIPQSSVIPGAVVIPPIYDIYRDGTHRDQFYAHQRTLTVLRAAKNFYTVDHHTSMSIEAALCGCNVFYVHKNALPTQQIVSKEAIAREVQNPARDVSVAASFRTKVLDFFGY